MLLSTTIGVLLSVASLSTLVIGDPLSVLTISAARVKNNPNEYFDPWAVEIIKTKKSSQCTVKIPTKKELPPTMQMKMTVGLKGQDPFEYAISICDALSDSLIGSSFVRAGVPKDKFPKACPFGPGDWTVAKWDPPIDKIPPGIPDGPVSGTVTITEEGKPPCIQIDFEGELSHALPGFGR